MKIISRKKLAETVRVLREKNRYTQEKLSDLTGINRAIISKIEREDFIPSITQFEALSDTSNFDPTEMFVEKENTNSFVNLKSETLSESEREGVEKLIKMMLTLRQQINIRRAYENELNQTQWSASWWSLQFTKEERLSLGFTGKTPIANDITLDILNIILVVVAYIDILVDYSIFCFKTKDAFCDAWMM